MQTFTKVWIVFALLLVSCGSAPARNGSTPSPTTTVTPEIPAPSRTPSVAPPTPSVAKTTITYIPSQDIGNIAVRISVPKTERYSSGAGVVVIVSPIFTEPSGFPSDPDLSSLGLIAVSYLWPGEADARSGARSQGAFDYGGPNSIAALRDVVRFASGVIPDKDGRFITDLVNSSTLTVLPEEVGLYAFADAGIAAVTMFSLYGDETQNVQYLVGRENPTGDVTANLEIGYQSPGGEKVQNPTYQYPQSYSPLQIKLDYKGIRWDAAYKNSRGQLVGRPYLDLDGDGTFSSGDFAFSDQVPVMSGKYYYSSPLTQALLDDGALTTITWPADLATPDEVNAFWSFRQSLNRFESMGGKVPDVKFMLVFAKDDHAQVAADKPHIHQMFQGLRFVAVRGELTMGYWVRLNPDRSYVQAFLPSAGLDFPDNPANTQPEDWTKIGDYAYPNQGNNDQLVTLAGIAEMADRTHFADWDQDLAQVFPLNALP